jgi:hypothetical protein
MTTTTDKPKTAALDVNVPVVRSEKLPATPKPTKFRDFDRFEKAAEEIREWTDKLEDIVFRGQNRDHVASGDVEDDWEYIESLLADAKVGFARFDRDVLYDIEDNPNLFVRTLKPDHIAKRLGVMLSAFPAANPGTPKGYARMLVEHVGAIENLTAVALESSCREIERTQKFAPAISEVFRVVIAHVANWTALRRAIETAERYKIMAIAALMEHEAKRAKEEHDAAVQKASNEVATAKSIVRQSAERIEAAKAQLAKDIETATANIARLEQDHANWEQRTSERQRKLAELTTPPHKTNGSGASP